jgi:hypothetical protein
MQDWRLAAQALRPNRPVRCAHTLEECRLPRHVWIPISRQENYQGQG